MLKQKQQGKHRSRFQWINWAIIAISMIAAVVYIIVIDHPQNIIDAICSIRLRWLAVAAVMLLLYWMFEALTLHTVVKRLHRPQKFRDTLQTTMVGQFYNCVTPFATGGQPMQAYTMVKSGVPLGIAGSSLLIRFIIYQAVLTLYSLVALILFWPFFASRLTGIAFLSAVGFAVNGLVMAALLCVGFARTLAKRIAIKGIRLLAKLRIVKKPEERIIETEAELERFYEGVQLARRNIVAIVQMMVFSFLQLTAFFLIPFFLCLAFGQKVSPFEVIAAQAFVTMISSFIPLPGAAGGAELSFMTFFSLFISGSNLNISMLLWRMLTFYAPLLVGGIVSINCSNPSEAYELNRMEMENYKKKVLEENSSSPPVESAPDSE